MAVEVESQGQLQDFLEILRKRAWQVAIPALLVFALGCAVAVVFPRKYVVETQIELREVKIDKDAQPRAGGAQGIGLEVGTAHFQIRSAHRIRRVLELIDDPDFPKNDSLAATEYIRKIRDNIDVTVQEKAFGQKGGSDFIDIRYKDTDPARAEEFLNRLAAVWIEEVIERDRETLRREMEVLQNTQEEARTRREDYRAERTLLISENDLDIVDVLPGNVLRQEDYLRQQLEQRKSRKRELEVELEGLIATIEEKREHYEELPAWENQTFLEQSGIQVEQEVQDLELQIAGLTIQQERFKPANSQWLQLQDEKKVLQARIDALLSVEQTESTQLLQRENQERVVTAREIERLDQSRAGLAREIEELQRQIHVEDAIYNERLQAATRITMLAEEIDVWDQKYDEAFLAWQDRQLKLEILSKAYGEPYEVVEYAIAPETPSEPNPFLIVAFSLVGGLAIGLGSAVLSEFSKNCYRGVHDITRVMAVPVLGVVGTIVTKAEVRRVRLQRLVMGLSSAIVLGGIGFFTYAYAVNPEMLPTSVIERIEEFRAMLR